MDPSMRKSRPAFLPLAAAVPFFVLLLSLGFWQLDRAQQKETLYRQLEERARAPVVDLAAAGAARANAEDMHWRRVMLRGRYDPVVHFLLDNQVYRGRPGYFVYTPFLLAGESVRVLVNRGWVDAGADRGHAPDVET